MYLWQEGWPLKDASGETIWFGHGGPPLALGGYVFVYYRNDGPGPFKPVDLALEGIRLSEGLGQSKDTVGEFHGHSILLSKLPKGSIELLKKAGHPAWWKPEPGVVERGGIGQIVIRLKREPRLEKLSIAIIGEKETARASVSPKEPQPRFATIAFNPALDTVFLYTNHPKGGGMKPTAIFLDGMNVTAACRIGSDRSVAIVPIVLKLNKPLESMSYHCFRAAFADGSAATAGIRAWGQEMIYGMFGASLASGPSEEMARRYLTDWLRHNINTHMGMSSGPANEFFQSEEGWKFTESIGIRRMVTWPRQPARPALCFLMDEPDAHDFAIDDLPPFDRLGCLGQDLVKWDDVLRRKGPDVPILLNVDNTYKPENWYTYHQLADVPCIDPYFPEQLDYVYDRHPGRLPAHTKPTYVYAAAAISQSSCQPKPLHVILCSTKYRNESTGYEGRYPTPEEKRMEVYYALAAGAKGLSYWWFSADSQCQGCGKDEPEAQRLWQEIGLLGAEVRTVGDFITTSCPAPIPLKAKGRIWVRTLISGLATLGVIVVNDDVLCDRLGTVVKPVENASVTLEIPAWLTPADAFEVTYKGLEDVRWKQTGKHLRLDLGTLDVSRFILITGHPELRRELEKRYREHFAANVADLLRAQ